MVERVVELGWFRLLLHATHHMWYSPVMLFVYLDAFDGKQNRKQNELDQLQNKSGKIALHLMAVAQQILLQQHQMTPSRTRKQTIF